MTISPVNPTASRSAIFAAFAEALPDSRQNRKGRLKELEAALGAFTPLAHQIYSAQRILPSLAFQGEGRKPQILYLPTGGGKTLVAGAVGQFVRRLGLTFGFYVPALDLLVQTSERFRAFGLDPHIYHADYDGFEPAPGKTIVGIHQTMRNRIKEGETDGIAQVCCFDEAHQTHYRSVFGEFIRRAVLFGLSATPFAPDLRKFWDPKWIVGAAHSELQARGMLAEMELFGIEDFDREEHQKDRFVFEDGIEAQDASDEFGAKTAKAEAVFERALRLLPADLEKHGVRDGDRFLVKCSNIERAQRTLDETDRKGFGAWLFNSEIEAGSKAKRKIDAIFSRAPDTPPIAIVVQQFAIGYDHSGIDAAVFMNNTKFQVFVQTAGRALRKKASGGKGKVIDLAANVAIHGARLERLINDPPGRIAKPREAPFEEGPKGKGGRSRSLPDKDSNRIVLAKTDKISVFVEGKDGVLHPIRQARLSVLAIVARAVQRRFRGGRTNEEKQALTRKVFSTLTGLPTIDEEPVHSDLGARIGARIKADSDAMRCAMKDPDDKTPEWKLFQAALAIIDSLSSEGEFPDKEISR